MKHTRANPWIAEQNRLWRELASSTITRWVGLDESAGTDDELLFLDRDGPFQQLGELRVEREGAAALDFCTYQNDDVFPLALRASDGAPQDQGEWRRVSDLGHLPTGPVERLEVRIDDRGVNHADPIEVQFTIGGRAVLVVAAEVWPTWTEPTYMWGGESFFVFTDPSLADAVDWGCERSYFSRVIPDDGVDVFE